MSETKVPKDLLTTTVARISSLPQFVNHRGSLYDVVQPVVDAFACVLSEHPITPSVEQQKQMTARKSRDAWQEDDSHFYSVEWQRRMFIAPEPEIIEPDLSAYSRATQAIGAVTLTRAEGEKIIEFVRGAIHDEIPEDIKSLLFEKNRTDLWADETNFRIRQAYNLGKAAR